MRGHQTQDFFFLPKERNQACFQKLREPSHQLVDPICAVFSDMLQVHKLQTKDLKKKKVKKKESETWVLMRRPQLDSWEEGQSLSPCAHLSQGCD